MSRSVRIAIIGAGTAGLSALAVVRRHTEDFVLINDGAYGTTCARVGCMPSKALIDVARSIHGRHYLQEAGITGGEPAAADVPAVLRHVRSVRDELVKGVLKLTDGLDERNIAGRARFTAPDALEVNGERIEAKRIVIATGSRPVVPATWRELGDRLVTSDELFEQEALPRRMAVIGLGAVGAEIAQALARLGVEVTGFDATGQVAGVTDPQVNEAAVGLLSAELAAVHLGAPAEPIRTGEGVRITAGGSAVEVDKVLVALGRRPNLDGLGLERLEGALDPDGRPRFDPSTLQISDLPVYIAGDVNAHAPVLHEAADEGWIAGYNVLRPDPACFDRRTRLAIVFTDPEIAVVGRGFSDIAQDQAVIGEARLAGQGRLRMTGRDRGSIRVYAEAGSGRLVGAELCAPDAGHLAHFLALAIQQRSSVADLLRAPYYHPTVEEALRSALRDAGKKLPGERGPDLANCEGPQAAALD